jgi:hypothetical protein
VLLQVAPAAAAGLQQNAVRKQLAALIVGKPAEVRAW